jgi:ribonucleoside-diphosphate reductase alpha chain
MGHTKNPDIRIAKSIVDYIFRWLGITFLPGFREAQQGLPAEEGPSRGLSPFVAGTTDEVVAEQKGTVPFGETKPVGHASSLTALKPAGSPNGQKPAGTRPKTASAKSPSPSGLARHVDLNGGPDSSQSEQFAQFQLDAPSCDNCGSITVRSGNCYLCYNCGNSMGCS